MGGGHAHCGTLVYLGDRFPAELSQHRLHVQRPRPAHQQRHPQTQGLRLHGQPRQGLHDRGRSLVHGRDAAHRPRRQRLRFRLVRHRRMPHLQARHHDTAASSRSATARPRKPNVGSHQAQRRRIGETATAPQRLVRPACPPAVAGTRGQAGLERRAAPFDVAENAGLERARHAPALARLWALHVTGGLDHARLLSRCWTIAANTCAPGRSSCCAKTANRPPRRSPSFATWRRAIHRRSFVSIWPPRLQRLPLQERWADRRGPAELTTMPPTPICR